MKIDFCNSNDKAYQRRLNRLLAPIFVDFQFWYDLDLWDANYESYSIAENGEIVSNLCAYKARILLRGRHHNALSVGAVATAPGLRGRGLSRLLMEHVIAKYPHTPMYLFANDSVLNFYPRFGFVRTYEKQPVARYTIQNAVTPAKLELDNPKIWHYAHNRVNFSQEMDCLNTASINLFHLRHGYLSGRVYDIPALETIVVAEQNGDKLHIDAVFSLREISFADLAVHLPFVNVNEIRFGFMPCWNDLEYEMVEYSGDPLFVRNFDCTLGDLKFPKLSET